MRRRRCFSPQYRAVRLPHPPQCTKRIPGARATRHARSGHYHCPHLLGAAYPPRRPAHTPHGFGLFRAGHVADQCGIGPRTRRAVWPASRQTLSRSVRHRLAHAARFGLLRAGHVADQCGIGSRTSRGFGSIMQFGHRRAARTPPHGSAIRTCKRRAAEPFIRSTAPAHIRPPHHPRSSATRSASRFM